MLVGDNADPRPPMRDDLYSAASNLKSEIHHLDEVNDCMPELQESYRKTTTRRFYDVTALLSTHQNVSLTRCQKRCLTETNMEPQSGAAHPTLQPQAASRCPLADKPEASVPTQLRAASPSK